MLIAFLLKLLATLLLFNIVLFIVILLLFKFIPKESKFGKWIKRNLIEEVPDDLDI